MRLADYPLIQPHLRKTAILDTNLLLTAWCVKFDKSLLLKFKKLTTLGFGADEIGLLSALLELFPSCSTTPHVLTEVSNLTNSLASWMKDDWYKFLAKEIGLIDEKFEPSATVASDAIAFKFGLTDAALARLAATHVILTLDGPLTGLLEARQLAVINFNHLRQALLYS